jgi:hypothetical protein
MQEPSKVTSGGPKDESVVCVEAWIGKAVKTRVWRSIFRSGVGQSTLHRPLAIQLGAEVAQRCGHFLSRIRVVMGLATKEMNAEANELTSPFLRNLSGGLDPATYAVIDRIPKR